MKEPRFIQRCYIKNTPKDEIDGFDSLLQCDYMGSAEFEFGARSSSLKRVTSSLENFSFENIGVESSDGRFLYVIFDKREKEDVFKCVKMISDESYRTKEYVGIQYALDLSSDKVPAYHDKDVNVWWDIENDYFVILGKKNDAKKVFLALEKLREKWLSQGKI